MAKFKKKQKFFTKNTHWLCQPLNCTMESGNVLMVTMHSQANTCDEKGLR